MAGLTKVTSGGITDGTITNADINSSASIDASKVSGLSTDKIEEGNTSVEVVDSGSDGHITFDTEGNERLRIDSSGNVLINTSTLPTSNSKLTVQNGSHCEVNIISSSSTGSLINMGDSDDYNIGRIKYDNNTNSFQFQTNNAERLRIDSSGNVGIGTTTGSGKLNLVQENATGLGDATNGAINIASSSGASVGRTNSINFLPGHNVTNPVASLGFVFTDSGGYGKGDLFFATRGSTSNAVSTERLRIDSSGNLSFSQSASSSYPEQKLKWSNDSTTANGFYISQDSNRNGRIFHEQGLDILFGTSNTERMRIDYSGNVGIGRSSPGAQLDVAGDCNFADNKVKAFTSSGHGEIRIYNSSNTQKIRLNGTDGAIVATGNVSSEENFVAGSSTSNSGGNNGCTLDHEGLLSITGTDGTNNIKSYKNGSSSSTFSVSAAGQVTCSSTISAGGQIETTSSFKGTGSANTEIYLGYQTGTAAFTSAIYGNGKGLFKGGVEFGDGTVQTTAAGGGPQVIAWANLNSSNSVLGSSGFSSITNVSSGIFTATFSSSLSNANYAVAGTVQQDDYIVSQPQNSAQGSSSFNYRLGSSGNHGNFNHSIMVVRG